MPECASRKMFGQASIAARRYSPRGTQSALPALGAQKALI